MRASNPSPFTLDGTNSYIAAGWVIDPGPADDAHLEAILQAAPEAIQGIALTHAHQDHAEGAPALSGRTGAPVVLPGGDADVGPFKAIATPGHSPDHVCLLLDGICFAGDLIAGEGSIFVPPGEGSLAAYMASLQRLRELEPDVICPGHGPFVHDPRSKIDEYIEHRLDRERRLVAALERGLRATDDLLDEVWDDAPPELRVAAAWTLDAHLGKLRAEGRLPADLP